MRFPERIVSILHRTLAVALLGLAVAAPVSAGWSPLIGGPGGPAVELHLDPDRPELLYARVQARIGGFLWRSLDAGTTWRSLQTGLGHPVSALALDPGDPRVIWAWTPEGELWRSGDAGEAWSRRFASSPISSHDVVQLLVDPRQPETIYRVEEGRSGDRFGLRVAVSRDGGTTFHTGAFLPFMYSGNLMSVSSRSGELFAFTTKGLAVSADGGRTWRMRGRFHHGFLASAMAPSDPDTLYALPAGTTFLARSDDAGANWRVMKRPRLPSYSLGFYGVAVDPRNARHVWLSAYVEPDEGGYPHWNFESKDGGETWSAPLPMPIAGVVPAGSQVLYTGVTLPTFSEAGLYVSQDGGRHWQPKDQGIVSGDLHGLVAQLLPDGRRRLLALTPISYHLGLIRSDGGEAWVRLPLRAAEIIGAGGSAVVAAAVRGLVRSEDGGDTWSAAAPAPPGAGGLLSDLNQPRYLAVRSHVGEEGSGNAFLWTSDDGGASWRFASDGLPAACGHEASLDYCPGFFGYVVDPFDAKRRWVLSYRGVFGPVEIFASQDAGASWHSIAVNPLTSILDLAADPTVRDRLLAGTTAGLMVSEDGGAHWNRLGQGLPGNSSVLQFVRDGHTGTWYVSVIRHGARYHSGIYRSMDGGASWTLLAGAPDTSVAGIMVDPTSPTALLAAFPGQGLWRWTP
ncbi:MAG: WD40/YVTN/BNR-like repeat-containing protein [Thermoanaerobaculia bacterium]